MVPEQTPDVVRLIQALHIEGLLGICTVGPDTGGTYPKISIVVSPTTHGDALLRASYQAMRALRVCTTLTGKSWGVGLTAAFYKSPEGSSSSSGPITLILEETETDGSVSSKR